MRSTLAAALIGLFLLPAATMAQTATQTAAVDAANAAPAAPTATAPTGGISRDQFVQRAKDRAAQRATTRFDQMDANHDGMLDRAEIQAWRTEHPRRSRSQSNQPTQ